MAFTIAAVFIAGIYVGWSVREVNDDSPDNQEREFLEGLGRVVGVKQ